MKIVLVVGLPGSGKSQWTQQRAGPTDYIVDDPTDWAEIVDRYQKAYADRTTLYVVDPHLCEPTVYAAAMIKLSSLNINMTDIQTVYFENNPKQCMINVQSRKGQKANSIHDIYALTLNYKPPLTALPIYNVNSHTCPQTS